MKAGLRPIGYIKTPYQALGECPRNVDPEGPLCELVLDRDFAPGVTGLKVGQKILVLYWFDEVERHTLVQKRHKTGREYGVFALRTPHRPNPIAAAVVAIEDILDERILVKGLDCLNGTPLLDIKPALSTRQTNRNDGEFVG